MTGRGRWSVPGAVRALVILLGAAVVVLLLGTSASAVTPTPAPAPSSGAFHADTWHCDDTTQVGVPDVTGNSGTGTADCAVQSWATEAPATVTPPGTSTVEITEAQWGVIGLGFGLVVLLLSAMFVSSWKS